MKTIGILGGMGPEATRILFKKITRKTPAKQDQHHIPIIIYSNTQIPDRTEAILYGGADPFPEMLRSLRVMESANPGLILIPCNTAHYYLHQLQQESSVPIMNMIRETADFIQRNYPEVKNVGLLATTGTIETKLYQQELHPRGLEVIVPHKESQEKVMFEAIYGLHGIKAGYYETPQKILHAEGNRLIQRGAGLIIAGCTEVSIALEKNPFSCGLLDPIDIMAEQAVKKALDLTSALPVRD